MHAHISSQSQTLLRGSLQIEIRQFRLELEDLLISVTSKDAGDPAAQNLLRIFPSSGASFISFPLSIGGMSLAVKLFLCDGQDAHRHVGNLRVTFSVPTTLRRSIAN